MKRSLAAAVLVLTVVAPGFSPADHILLAQSKAKAENVPEIPFTSVPNFFKLPPDLYFGEGIGIATNSKGHVFVYTRSGDTRLLEFDQNGAYLRDRSGRDCPSSRIRRPCDKAKHLVVARGPNRRLKPKAAYDWCSAPPEA